MCQSRQLQPGGSGAQQVRDHVPQCPQGTLKEPTPCWSKGWVRHVKGKAVAMNAKASMNQGKACQTNLFTGMASVPSNAELSQGLRQKRASLPSLQHEMPLIPFPPGSLPVTQQRDVPQCPSSMLQSGLGPKAGGLFIRDCYPGELRVPICSEVPCAYPSNKASCHCSNTPPVPGNQTLQEHGTLCP